MRVLKNISAVLLMFSVVGCVAAGPEATHAESTKNLPVSYALQGTSTAVVGIAVDQKGFPLETVREIVLRPGQKVIFAGPDRFQIVFKDKKSPNNMIRQESKNGTITVNIPKDILVNGAYVDEFKRNKYLKFNYSIFVNGKELDPPLIVRDDF